MKILLFLLPLVMYAQTDLPGPLSALPNAAHTTANGVCSWNANQTQRVCIKADNSLSGGHTIAVSNTGYLLDDDLTTTNIFPTTTGKVIGSSSFPYNLIRSYSHTIYAPSGSNFTLTGADVAGSPHLQINNGSAVTIFDFRDQGSGNNNLSILAHFYPLTNNTYDLGNAGAQWGNVYTTVLQNDTNSVNLNIWTLGTNSNIRFSTQGGAGPTLRGGFDYTTGHFFVSDMAGSGTRCASVDSSGNFIPKSVDCSTGTGTVTSIATTGPITGGTITTSGTIGCATCLVSTSGKKHVGTFGTFSSGSLSVATGLSSIDFANCTPFTGGVNPTEYCGISSTSGGTVVFKSSNSGSNGVFYWEADGNP